MEQSTNGIIVADYTLDFIAKLSEYLGKEVMNYYGEIVEAAEETGANYNEATLRRKLLHELCRLEPRVSRWDQKVQSLSSEEGFTSILKNDWDQLPHRLVESHIGLVKQVAATYYVEQKVDNEETFKDLLSAGEEALVLAAEKYFQRPKGEFRSFAWDKLRSKMKEEVSRKHPVPYKTRRKLTKLAEIREQFRIENNELDKESLGEALGCGEAELKELLETESIWGNGLEFESDTELEEVEYPDLNPNALGILLQTESEVIIQQALGYLGERERLVIDQLYFQDKSGRQVAEELELSLTVLKKVHKRALQDLKSYVASME